MLRQQNGRHEKGLGQADAKQVQAPTQRSQSSGRTSTPRPNLGVAKKTADVKIPMVCYPWQANATEMPTKQPLDSIATQQESSKKQDAQVVLSKVASLQVELDKLTGDMVAHKRRIYDTNAQHASNLAPLEEKVTPSILADDHVYAGLNSPTLQPEDSTTVVIDSQENDTHGSDVPVFKANDLQQNQVFRVTQTVMVDR